MNKRENVCIDACKGIPTDVLKRLVKNEGARRDFARRAVEWVLHNSHIFYSEEEIPVVYNQENCELL